MNNYTFTNNGFRIIAKPLSVLSLIITVTMVLVMTGMTISPRYTFFEALRVLYLIPASIGLIGLSFSITFIRIYFTFTIEDNQISIRTWRHHYHFPLSSLTKVSLVLDNGGQDKLKLHTKEKTIVLYLVGSGGRMMYNEFFDVIKELQKKVQS